MKFLNLFHGKPTIHLKQFVKDYHLAQINEPTIIGISLYPNSWRAVFEYVKVADPSLDKASRDVFLQEMIALNLELFGLAWCHHIQSERPCIWEAIYTKAFLEENDLKDIWSAMLFYNREVARTYESLPARTKAARTMAPLASEEMVAQAHRDFSIKLRNDTQKLYITEGFDSECVRLFANRLSAGDDLNDRPLFEILAEVVANRINCKLNIEGMFRIRCIAKGLYKSAQQSIRSVDMECIP